MCGIAVAVNWPDAEKTVNIVLGGLLHRGLVTDPTISAWRDTALATRRLPIVAPEAGQQPKLSADGRVLVAFNGEIYNYRQLRRELQDLGIHFDGDSDTEVLANLISKWGSGALRKIVGIYGFVALDLQNRDFLAARDPMGVKPLYVIQSDTGFLFSSEISPLLQASETGDVLLLPPGHVLSKAGCFRVLAPPHAASPHRAQSDPKTLDLLLAEAVGKRLPTDVPFALLLSGGIDSTLVAHYARQIRPDAPAYFLGSDTAPDFAYAAEYARATGLDLRRVTLKLEPSVSMMRSIVRCAETYEPDVVRNTYCTGRLAERLHEDGFRVALSGEGADELFAGYPPLEAAFAADEAIGQNLREQYLSSMHRSNLQRLDRGGMAHQVEIREPFLDPGVVAYARSLDGSALTTRLDGVARGKAPLRALYDLYPDQLPRTIRERQKIPMAEGAGLEQNLKDSPWSEYADTVISDGDFHDLKHKYSSFDLKSKEEVLYISLLNEMMDISRVPHLTVRNRLFVPHFPGVEALLSHIGLWVDAVRR